MQQIDLFAAPAHRFERVQLPRMVRVTTYHMMSWTPALPVSPDPELLKALKSRRSRTGANQSEMSKRRQHFITGMSRYRMSPEEREARKRYEEEWRWRVGDD